MPNRVMLATADGDLIPSSEVPVCPDCGAYLKKIEGPYGDFLGCSNYPGCKFKASIKDDPFPHFDPNEDMDHDYSRTEIDSFVRDLYGRSDYD